MWDFDLEKWYGNIWKSQHKHNVAIVYVVDSQYKHHSFYQSLQDAHRHGAGLSWSPGRNMQVEASSSPLLSELILLDVQLCWAEPHTHIPVLVYSLRKRIIDYFREGHLHKQLTHPTDRAVCSQQRLSLVPLVPRSVQLHCWQLWSFLSNMSSPSLSTCSEPSSVEGVQSLVAEWNRGFIRPNVAGFMYFKCATY